MFALAGVWQVLSWAERLLDSVQARMRRHLAQEAEEIARQAREHALKERARLYELN